MKEDNNRKKKNKRTRDADADVVRQPPPLLVRSSSSTTGAEKNKKNKKKQQQQQRGQFEPSSIIITQSISNSRTRTITITPPPEEDPEMNISLYLCIQFNSDPDGRNFRWCIIYPTNSPYLQSEPEPIFLYPISYMPATTPTDIHLVASPFSGPPYSNKMKKNNKNKDRKVVYAVGGLSNEEDPLPYGCRSSKAFVCDLGSISAAWEELPPMSSPKLIHIGAVSTSDGKLYVFGHAAEKQELPNPICRYRTITSVKDIAEGDVFDPSSRSWTPCPPPYLPLSRIDDYTFDKEENELVVFTDHEVLHTFDPTTTHEQCVMAHTVPLSPRSDDRVSSCVVVGDTIYKFHLGELYALNRNSELPSFQRVPGLRKKLDSYLSDPECITRAYLSYHGNGKFALVWGGTSIKRGAPHSLLFIKLLKFWVGVCNQTNRRRAIVDKREEYVTEGYWLHDCVAL
ncbi:hypothetical protein LguiB_005314 [Lonicera macranthoides]